jgi:serpin B
MQQISHSFPFTKLENCAALELAFGNGAFSLVVVLPDKDTDISKVVEQMNGDWWDQIITGLDNSSRYNEVHLAIPRFRMVYERHLADDLMALGMKTLFSGGVDFSFISSQENLFISDVFQKTFAQMDEGGMRVAAATVIQWVYAGDEEPPKYTRVDFNVNRPFLYFIKEKSTKLVFFSGIMNKIT